MASNAPQKPPDATCPMCGSKLAGSPAGKAHLQKLQQVGQHMAKAGVQAVTPRPQQRPAHPGGYSSGLRPPVR